MSALQETYREQYGQYAYWCLGVKDWGEITFQSFSGAKVFNSVIKAACPKHVNLVFNVYKMHYIGSHIPCYRPTYLAFQTT